LIEDWIDESSKKFAKSPIKQSPIVNSVNGMDKKITDLINNWQKRNIQGIYCHNKEEARKRILEIIPKSASVGFSGSNTLISLGIIEALESRANLVFNQYKAGMSRGESFELRKQGVMADYFLGSANAISQKGEMVFFSAYGNRTAGLCNAKNVIVVCGINKVTPDITEALKRARQYVTPLNCKRLNWHTPCLESGICQDEKCLFPEYQRMCCQVLIIEAEVVPHRLKVILVGEDLGY
jgi:hypothetical protein